MTTLGALCAESGGGVQTGPFGSQLHAADYVAVGVPSVMPQNIGDNTISADGIAMISDADAERLSKYRLRTGDIVYSRRGDVEKRAYVRPEHDGWLCGTGCLRVRLGEDAPHDSRFISYQLGTAESRAWIVRHAVGATMPNLNTGILSGVPISAPPMSEQQAIAEVLGALDDKIATNVELASTAESLASALFSDAVHGIEVSDDTFSDIADVRGGGTPRTGVEEYWDGDINWATPTDVTGLSGPYLESTARRITKEGLKACASPLFPSGSIMMTSRATIGAFAVAQQPTATNQGFIVVNPHDPLLTWWIFHEMRSRVHEFVSLANGATFLELSRGNFKKFRVRLADDPTMTSFGMTASSLHSRARQAFMENERLAETRDVLLPQLMSGKIRVKDVKQRVGDVV